MSISPVRSNNQSSSFAPAKMSQVRQDFKALPDSLSSGDIDGAQKAFAAFKQDIGKAHGRHHHRRDNDTDATSSNGGTDSATSGTSSSAPDTPNSSGSSTSLTLTLSLTLINFSGTTSTSNPTGSLVNLTA